MEAKAAMRWKSSRFGLVLSVCAFAAQGLTAPAQIQSGPVAPRTTLIGELQSLATRAATVFAGQVICIQRKGGVVEITFRVDQAVLGQPGTTYTLREWAGLWPDGQFRYTVGERALIFLHAASSAGLGSPVDGAEGVVPIVVQGADAPALLDIRRLSAALQRNLGTPLPSETNGAIQLSDAVSIVAAACKPAAPQPHPPLRLPIPVHGTPPRLMPAIPPFDPNTPDTGSGAPVPPRSTQLHEEVSGETR